MNRNMFATMYTVKKDSISAYLESLRLSILNFGQLNHFESISFIQPDVFQLLYIEEGTLELDTPQGTHLCQERSAIVLLPHDPYKLHNPKHPQSKFYFLSFKLLNPGKIDSFLYLMHQDLLNHMDFSFLTDLFCEAMENHQNPYPTLYLALVKSLRHMIPNEFDVRSCSLVSDTFRFVGQNLNQPISIQDISRQLHVSESALYKAFTKKYKSAPKKVLTQYKINLSLELLQTSDLSLEEIAAIYGFTSGSHYSRTFKNLLGYPPREVTSKLNSPVGRNQG